METNYEFAGYLSEITAYLLRGQSAVDLLASDEEDRMDEESTYAIFRNSHMDAFWFRIKPPSLFTMLVCLNHFGNLPTTKYYASHPKHMPHLSLSHGMCTFVVYFSN